jgi:hypothetical protein
MQIVYNTARRSPPSATRPRASKAIRGNLNVVITVV